MELYDAAWQLSDLLETNRSVYVRMEPEVPDFTKKSAFKMFVCGLRQEVVLEVNPQNIMFVIGLFDSTIFSKEMVDRLYFWDIKALCSYFRFVTSKDITPQTNLIDLKVIESFLNTRKPRPENLIEAVNRAKLVVQEKGWHNLYKSIHLPLSLRVLPSIETSPLIHEGHKDYVYPYYEIEGQSNGRLNCSKKFICSYLPHNMGPDVRTILKPIGIKTCFLYSDFKHCEVTVLQWLSGDAKLKELLDTGEDLHPKIYEILTGDKCDTDSKRKMSKLMFLPVMYGCGAKRLAVDVLNVPEQVAAEIIRRIKLMFPIAWEWMQAKQEEAKAGVVYDYFGRPRKFEDGKYYLARDFVVQGVAATVCQEKLIELCKILDREKAHVVFTVHDGFGLVVKNDMAKAMYRLVKDTLEQESRLCAGLKMKVKIQLGQKLDKLKEYWKD